MSRFSVTFTGTIAVDHRLPLRIMAATYEHVQRSIERAYLVELYGDVWKHARLTDQQYAEAEFTADWPREGSIVLDAFRHGAGAMIDRVYSAVRPLFEEAANFGMQQAESLSEQLANRRDYVAGMGERTRSFGALIEDPPANWAAAYSNRSIVKEIDQLVTQITPARYEGSAISIRLQGSQWHPRFDFTAEMARRFHRICSLRELAAPVVVDARIRTLDHGNKYSRPKAKIINLNTNREVVLHLSSEADFLELHPFHTVDHVGLFVCPIVEAGGFDVNGGDLQYLAVVGAQ